MYPTFKSYIVNRIFFSLPHSFHFYFLRLKKSRSCKLYMCQHKKIMASSKILYHISQSSFYSPMINKINFTESIYIHTVNSYCIIGIILTNQNWSLPICIILKEYIPYLHNRIKIVIDLLLNSQKDWKPQEHAEQRQLAGKKIN